MPFSAEDKHAIELLRQTKQYGAKHLMSMFPDKQWSLSGLKKLIRKIDDTGTVDRRSTRVAVAHALRVLLTKSTKLMIWFWARIMRQIPTELNDRQRRTSITDVNELRRRIAEECDKLEQRIIDKAVGERRKRLRACVAAGGGQFEHKL